MSLPKHLSNVPSNRKAVAPYNFVELPDQVVPAPPPPDHDCYYGDRLTGKIECTLTTASPLYIRCGLSTEQFQREQQAKDFPDFFINPANQSPVIPGSSLRGMFRTLVEIISFSKFERISNNQRFFFRAVAAKKDDPLASEYKKYISPKKIRAGYLVERHDGWYIRPALLIDDAPFVWVQDNKVCSTYPDFISVRDSAYRPQYIDDVGFEDIYVKYPRSFAGRLSANPDTCKYRGVLVTSGNMSESGTDARSTKRRNHCLVREGDKKADLLKISDDAIQDYCSALTDFQQQEPPFKSRKGFLSDGRCIFYCQPKAGQMVSLFGQSPNFRIPYFSKDDGKAASALDFLPEGLLNSTTIDLTDAIFGFVRSEKQEDHSQQACASRVSISDAICQKSADEDIWLKNTAIVPKTLGSPKPTTFQHYLVQNNADKPALKSYANKPNVETVIRGHKLYWHKGQSPDIELVNPDDVSDTQKTSIKPIRSGVEFLFAIHFENLSYSELGVLLWILNIAQDETYRLSLGMGKPLGMGAARIEHQLYLSDRPKRYTTLFNEENVWETGYSNPVASDEEDGYIAAFESFILQSLGTTGSFKELRRIKMLLAMLTWKENLSQAELDERRYMEIERDANLQHIGTPKKGKVNEYADRPVLPTPLQVIGWDDGEDDNNHSNPGSSGGGNSPKPSPRNPRGSDRPKPNPRNSSSNQGDKTAMELALERAQKKPKRK